MAKIRTIRKRDSLKLRSDFSVTSNSDWVQLAEAAKKQMPGVSIQVTVEVLTPDKAPNMRLIGYWYNEVVRKFRFGLIEGGSMLNMGETERWILQHLKDMTKEQAGHILLEKFITKIIIDRKAGTISEIVPTLTELTDAEFSGLFDPIICYAAENLGMQILYPNEFEE